MYQLLGWGLQILILTVGIYLFLRFLRRTRGGGLIRGLVVALLFGAVGLWGLAKLLGLFELEHIVQSITGFVVVIFAILFQPELRRGIAQLGEHPLLGRLLDKRHPETISEVGQAIVRLAKQRRGALVAFEREMPLDGYIENGLLIDAAARSILIESVFHPGGPLHDGAVVIRKDRVAAALCLFPLTENVEISKSTGTRHRAALGLTENSDAVTIAVSEETGDITICAQGNMVRKVRPEDVEWRLREALESESGAPSEAEGTSDALQWLRGLVTEDGPRKLAAVGLAVALFFVAHKEISSEHEVRLRVSSCGPDTIARAAPGELLVQLPTSEERLVSPRPGEIVRIAVSGKREALDELGRELGGVLKLDPTQRGLDGKLALRQVAFGPGPEPRELGLRIDWVGSAPRLVTEKIARLEIELEREHVELEIALPEGLEAELALLRFEPPAVTVNGPLAEIAELEAGRLRFALQPAVVRPAEPGEWTERLPLQRELAERGLSLEGLGTVRVVLPVHAACVTLEGIELPLSLVCLAPERAEELDRLRIDPACATARIRVKSMALLPQPGAETVDVLRRVIQTQLFAYADVGEAADGRAPVRCAWRRDWRTVLTEELGPLLPNASLSIELESAPQVPLIAREGAATIVEDGREQ